MCQGQISFQKTYKWAMETRGLKSNSSKLLCLSWLPATLMMIRSKMNKLAWRHHFPITSLWEIFWTSRAANSLVSGPVWPKFEILCMSSLPASIKRIGSKTTEKSWRHHFPHYKSMGAFCCHGYQSFDPISPKTYAAFPSPQWCYTLNLIKIGQLASEIFKFRSLKFSSLKGK